MYTSRPVSQSPMASTSSRPYNHVKEDPAFDYGPPVYQGGGSSCPSQVESSFNALASQLEVLLAKTQILEKRLFVVLRSEGPTNPAGQNPKAIDCSVSLAQSINSQFDIAFAASEILESILNRLEL